MEELAGREDGDGHDSKVGIAGRRDWLEALRDDFGMTDSIFGPFARPGVL